MRQLLTKGNSIKNLSRGSKVYLPVHVPGAKFSVGDLHFSQGDGEISFCGAIEMAGVITINFKVIKNGVADLGLKSPIYIPGPVEPQFGPGRYIYFEGFSVDEQGKQHYMDVTVAYRQTSLRESPSCPYIMMTLQNATWSRLLNTEYRLY